MWSFQYIFFHYFWTNLWPIPVVIFRLTKEEALYLIIQVPDPLPPILQSWAFLISDPHCHHRPNNCIIILKAVCPRM